MELSTGSVEGLLLLLGEARPDEWSAFVVDEMEKNILDSYHNVKPVMYERMINIPLFPRFRTSSQSAKKKQWLRPISVACDIDPVNPASPDSD